MPMVLSCWPAEVVSKNLIAFAITQCYVGQLLVCTDQREFLVGNSRCYRSPVQERKGID